MELKNIKKLFNYITTSKTHFNKLVTIKKYLAITPDTELKSDISFDELYEEAVKVVGKQDFKKNTKDETGYFSMLSKDESTIAVMLGILAFALSREVDLHGTSLEKAIDKILPKGYDTNNPFDVKEGLGHRIFGHDPAVFGLKNIPADTLIKVKNIETGERNLIKIGELLGVGTNGEVSMWDLIWKFYGNNSNKLLGIVNCLKHTIVHFAKDLLTPAGLPIPFSSLFEKYEYYEHLNAHGIMYKNSLMQKLDNLGIKLKASDFAAFFLIESFFLVYFKTNKVDEYKSQDIKLISIGTCISMQMAAIALGQGLQQGKRGRNKITPGGKINPMLSVAFVKLTLQEIKSIYKARKYINDIYDNHYPEVKINGQ